MNYLSLSLGVSIYAPTCLVIKNAVADEFIGVGGVPLLRSEWVCRNGLTTAFFGVSVSLRLATSFDAPPPPPSTKKRQRRRVELAHKTTYPMPQYKRHRSIITTHLTGLCHLFTVKHHLQCPVRETIALLLLRAA